MVAVTPSAVPVTEDATNVRRVTLSMRGLLAIYAVIPLCGVLYLVDRGVLGGAIRDALPQNPDHLFLYGLLFGWPHILASNVILASNAEYRNVYGKRAVIASAIIIAFFVIGNYALPYVVLSIVAATATIIHVLKQQIGIGAGAARLKGWRYPAWGWTSIVVGVLLYNALYLEDDLAQYERALELGALGLTCVVVILALGCARRIQAPIGRTFLWSNTALVVLPVTFHFAGYDIFALAIPRIIHDTTAFAFYVAHDHNRHRGAPRNPLFRAAAKLPGGVYWLSPVLAVALAFGIERYGDGALDLLTGGAASNAFPQAVSIGLLGFFAMLHYYTEAFTWKAGSPYRKFVSIRA